MSLGGGPHISLGMVRDAESDPQPVDHRRTKQSILPRITAEIKTELYQRPSRTLIAWDAIGQDIYAKHVFSRLIQTLTRRDDGKGAKRQVRPRA